MSLAKKITMAIAYRGMTKAAIARAIGMSRQRFYRKMKNGSFTLSELERIAGMLGAQYVVVFELEDGTKV